ncbi:MAG TPA: flagellar basal body L-ring protein FlgH [Limnochordales bacterium]
MAALVVMLVAAPFAFWSGPAAAHSLWIDGSSLYADNKARRVGDLVTIIIVERAQATQSTSTETGKNSSVDFGPILWGGVPLIPGFGGQAGDSFRGGGSTTRGGSLNARMTAMVMEVLPNGNLVIEGRQTIVVNDEEQIIVVTGVVRPQDIQPDNTVLSTFVANATITYHGTGSIGAKQEPGLLTRLLNWLF